MPTEFTGMSHRSPAYVFGIILVLSAACAERPADPARGPHDAECPTGRLDVQFDMTRSSLNASPRTDVTRPPQPGDEIDGNRPGTFSFVSTQNAILLSVTLSPLSVFLATDQAVRLEPYLQGRVSAVGDMDLFASAERMDRAIEASFANLPREDVEPTCSYRLTGGAFQIESAIQHFNDPVIGAFTDLTFPDQSDGVLIVERLPFELGVSFPALLSGGRK